MLVTPSTNQFQVNHNTCFFSSMICVIWSIKQNVNLIIGPLFWPTFIVAIATAIIASQAMISGAFAIISQSQKLGCFPRVRINHTSDEYEGQVYIPEVNYGLMIACVIVTIGFKTTLKIANAYGTQIHISLTN